MNRIFLVSCVSKKRKGVLPAKDLYSSAWFLKAKTFVEMQQQSWYILSAKYGLLEPDSSIESYNITLKSLKVKERKAWALTVIESLETKESCVDEVVIFAGKFYREFLVHSLGSFCGKVTVPLAGLRLGQQMSWFNARISNG